MIVVETSGTGSMRIGILFIVALLAGCATRPESATSTSYYHGVYAPGSTSVADDGKFVSTSAVIKADQLEIASEAALVRLVAAAQARGYTHVVVSRVRTDVKAGHGYRIEGQLFSASSAPPNAVAVGQIEATLLQHLNYVPERPARQPVFAIPEEKPSEEPVVIAAPDFVS